MQPKKVIVLLNPAETAAGILRYVLSTHGYRVLATTSVHEALHFLETKKADIFIADLILPCSGTNGNELIGILKADYPDLPMLLTSSMEADPGFDTHADAFLAKGHTPEILLNRIRYLVAGKRGARAFALAAAANGRPAYVEASIG